MLHTLYSWQNTEMLKNEHSFGLQFQRCQPVMSGAMQWSRVVQMISQKKGGGIQKEIRQDTVPGTQPWWLNSSTLALPAALTTFHNGSMFWTTSGLIHSLVQEALYLLTSGNVTNTLSSVPQLSSVHFLARWNWQDYHLMIPVLSKVILQIMYEVSTQYMVYSKNLN